MYDFLNSTTLAQKIVACSVVQITKILTIKNYKLDNIFLHIIFEPQSLLESTSDQIGSDTNESTEEDDHIGSEWKPIKIPQRNLTYVSNSIQHNTTFF
jgi:hypothetical protein